ncbi:transposase [uncultured Tateyamaria sp.]|uniref:REP-associated tyrosine transposase n=1 Tax=Tateyamaria sp. 1078 TaxID=3417464 RepID=UPI00260CC51A|nr:transposase [uncultured Tateyamaria sp.]
MSIYRRFFLPGRTFFFTVALADPSSDMLVRHVDVLRAAFAQTRAERPFACDAMVVLPDHLHAIWTMPEGDADFSTRIGAIKARFVMGLRRAGFSPPMDLPVVRSGRYAGLKPGLRRHKREIGVWQRRFWEHCIRDEADYAMHLRYCWLNPVKHGYVEHAEAWPYSSVHRDVRLGRVHSDVSGSVPDGAFGEPDDVMRA